MIRRPPTTTGTDKLVPYTTRCRSDPPRQRQLVPGRLQRAERDERDGTAQPRHPAGGVTALGECDQVLRVQQHGRIDGCLRDGAALRPRLGTQRSEEHTSELQSLMRISYAVFCLNKNNY